jgi:apolipoprotein N-acyltransferase
MIAIEPSSPQTRERERIILVKIFGPFGAIALVYGIVSAHPPLLFLTVFGLLGMAYAVSLLWGIRRKRASLATTVAFGLFLIVRPFIERAFFARPDNDMPWPAFVAELGAICLGCALAFAVSLLWKRAPDQPEANA